MNAPAGRSLSLCESTHPVKGQAWRHRLLRAAGMSLMAAPRPSLKLPGMLDEPVGSLPLHLERPLPQPIARHLGERQKRGKLSFFCFLLTGVLHRFVRKSTRTHECSRNISLEAFKERYKSGFTVSLMHFSDEILLKELGHRYPGQCHCGRYEAGWNSGLCSSAIGALVAIAPTSCRATPAPLP